MSKALLEMAGGLGSLSEVVKFDPEAKQRVLRCLM